MEQLQGTQHDALQLAEDTAYRDNLGTFIYGTAYNPQSSTPSSSTTPWHEHAFAIAQAEVTKKTDSLAANQAYRDATTTANAQFDNTVANANADRTQSRAPDNAPTVNPTPNPGQPGAAPLAPTTPPTPNPVPGNNASGGTGGGAGTGGGTTPGTSAVGQAADNAQNSGSDGRGMSAAANSLIKDLVDGKTPPPQHANDDINGNDPDLTLHGSASITPPAPSLRLRFADSLDNLGNILGNVRLAITVIKPQVIATDKALRPNDIVDNYICKPIFIDAVAGTVGIASTGYKTTADALRGQAKEAAEEVIVHSAGTAINLPIIDSLSFLNDLDPKVWYGAKPSKSQRLEEFRHWFREGVPEGCRDTYDNGVAAAPLTEQVVLTIILVAIPIATEAELVAATEARTAFELEEQSRWALMREVPELFVPSDNITGVSAGGARAIRITTSRVPGFRQAYANGSRTAGQRVSALTDLDIWVVTENQLTDSEVVALEKELSHITGGLRVELHNITEEEFVSLWFGNSPQVPIQ